MTLKMTEDDWKKLENLTDAEIEAACADDPDDYLPTPEELKQGWVRYPDQVDLFFPIEKETAEWFFKNRENYVPILQNALRQAITASQNSTHIS